MLCWGYNVYGQVMPFRDAVLRGLLLFAKGGGYVARLTLFVSLQVGDNSTTQRNTPVAVVGLSSGVAMVALGYVRLVGTCCIAVDSIVLLMWSRV